MLVRSNVLLPTLALFVACGGTPTDVPQPDDRTPPPRSPGQRVAFVNVNVIPMGDTEDVLTGHTVLVVDDRIVEVGADGTVSMDGATEIAGEGR